MSLENKSAGHGGVTRDAGGGLVRDRSLAPGTWFKDSPIGERGTAGLAEQNELVRHPLRFDPVAASARRKVFRRIDHGCLRPSVSNEPEAKHPNGVLVARGRTILAVPLSLRAAGALSCQARVMEAGRPCPHAL